MFSSKFSNGAEKVIDNIPHIEQLFGKSILITGGTGMICSAVADVLFYLNEKKNANIKVIFAGRHRESIERWFPEAKWDFVEFDATKPYETENEVDYVIYGASNADPKAIAEYPVETIMSNTSGLNNVVKNTTANRYLYISSSEVYGNSDKAPYREEDYGYVDILNMRACYPSSKRLAETLCVSYAEEYNKEFVIVRPGHIYGPTITKSDSRASAQFSRMAADGEDIVMKSAGSQLRSYTYVYDCASAILAVLINGEINNAYNISNKDSICTIKDIAEALAKAGGSKVVFEEASDSEKKSFNLMSNSSLNSDKIEKLGWKAAFDLTTGVEQTIEILKDLKQ